MLPMVPLEPVIINMVGCWGDAFQIVRCCILNEMRKGTDSYFSKEKNLYPSRPRYTYIHIYIYTHTQDRCARVKNLDAYPHVLEMLELCWACAEFRAKPKLRFQGTEILPTVLWKCCLQMLKIPWDQLFLWALLHHGLYQNQLQNMRPCCFVICYRFIALIRTKRFVSSLFDLTFYQSQMELKCCF